MQYSQSVWRMTDESSDKPQLVDRSILFRIVLVLLLIGITMPVRAQNSVDVVTQHNDNSRTGANLGEKILTTANVNIAQFGKLFTRAVDAEIYAQPLYVAGVAIPGRGNHNVVYAATMNNTVYAYDADDPAASTALWSVNLGPPVPAKDVQCCCLDISTQIGILSTPVIDLATGTIYLVSRNKNVDGTYHQWLNALDIATGAQKFSGPTEIVATYGKLTFNPKIQNQRPALLLSRGIIYIAWASHNDCGAYHGWVMGYDAASLSQSSVYVDTVNGSKGGIWQGGQGPTVDANGNVYVVTGNGSFDGAGTASATNLGNSVVRLTVPQGGGLNATDYFTPYNYDTLNAQDADLGCGGILGIPGTSLLITGSKQGNLYLLDSNNLGHFHAGSNSNALQTFGAASGHIHGSPVFYNSPINGATVYIWSENDYLKAFSFNGKNLTTTPIAYSPMQVPSGMPGGFMSISSSGKANDNGILWVSHPYKGNANNAVVEGVVRAFDASTIVTDSGGTKRLKELWNSKQNDTRDAVGRFAKFCSPTVANGKVYMATFGTVGSTLGTGQLVVYGLLPAVKPPAPTNLVAVPADTAVSLSWTSVAGAKSYNLYRSATAGGGGATAYKTGVAYPYTDTAVTNGTTYYYRVKASNSDGDSDDSNEANATPSADPAPSSLILAPVADAFVRSGGYANTNYGGSTQLVTKKSVAGYTRYSFVKFDLSALSGSIATGKLRLYGSRAGKLSSAESCYAVSDTTWTEKGINWNRMPGIGDKQTTTNITSSLSWYEWDVTAYLQAQQLAGKSQVTLALTMDTAPADGQLDVFNSREAAANTPQMAIALNNAGTIPVKLTADMDDTLVTLTWNGVAGTTSYNLYRSTIPGGEGTTPYMSGVTAPCPDSSVTNGTTYYYRVTAVSGGVESAQSNEVAAIPAVPVYPNFLDFNAATGLTLNGSAKLNGVKLELTDGGLHEAGSVFFSTLTKIKTFHSTFSFVLTNPNADGFTFVIQNTQLSALGSSEGGLGYGIDPSTKKGTGIDKSVAIKFDLYANAGKSKNTTGLYTDGVAPEGNATDLTGAIDLHSGHTFNVAMIYDGTTLSVTITDATTNASATQIYTIDIPGTVGSNNAYVGFTGATGGLSATQDILNWAMSK